MNSEQEKESARLRALNQGFNLENLMSPNSPSPAPAGRTPSPQDFVAPTISQAQLTAEAYKIVKALVEKKIISLESPEKLFEIVEVIEKLL